MSYNTIAQALFRKLHCRRRDYDMLDIPTDPEKMIQYVEFDYDCSFDKRAFVWLLADSACSKIRYFTECPCRWQLDRKVQSLVLVSSTPLLPECVQTSMVHAEPQE